MKLNMPSLSALLVIALALSTTVAQDLGNAANLVEEWTQHPTLGAAGSAVNDSSMQRDKATTLQDTGSDPTAPEAETPTDGSMPTPMADDAGVPEDSFEAMTVEERAGFTPAELRALLATHGLGYNTANDPPAEVMAAEYKKMQEEFDKTKQLAEQLRATRQMTAGDMHIQGVQDVIAAAEEAGIPFSAVTSVSETPDFWDSRRQTYGTNRAYVVSPVRSQGGCGSCVGFATIAGAESAYCAAMGVNCSGIMFSVMDLYNCGGEAPSRTLCNVGGWNVGDAGRVLGQRGVTWESLYPYNPIHNVGCINNRLPRALAGQFVNYDLVSIADIQAAVRENGAVVVGFDVYADFFGYWYDGATTVYRWDGKSVRLGGHAVAIVGYNDTERSWLFKNSWGVGDEEYMEGAFGFGRIAYDANNIAVGDWRRRGIRYQAAAVCNTAYAGFTFIQGVNSNSYSVPSGTTNLATVATICAGRHNCLGFTPDGVLKLELLPRRLWFRWSNDRCKGMWVKNTPCVVPGYTFYPNLAFPATSVGTQFFAVNANPTFTALDIAARCNTTNVATTGGAVAACTAFSTDGKLRAALNVMQAGWITGPTNQCRGIYVKNGAANCLDQSLPSPYNATWCRWWRSGTSINYCQPKYTYQGAVIRNICRRTCAALPAGC